MEHVLEKKAKSRSRTIVIGRVDILCTAVLFLFFFLSSMALQGQSKVIDLGGYAKQQVDSAILAVADPIYNLNFQEAEVRIRNLEKMVPGHPIVDLVFALKIVWETIPDPTPTNFEEMERRLKQSLEKVDLILDQDKEDPEGIFYEVMAHGLLAQYYNLQGSPFKAFSEAKNAYSAVTKGFELKEQNIEFLFSCGLYNYYRERYPEVYPVYKSFVWIFRRGDTKAGIRQLEQASKKTVFARIEATHYLAYIYNRFENKPREAERLLQPLVSKYPRNLYFKMLLTESFMLQRRIDQKLNTIGELLKSEKRYYQACGMAFDGVYREKYNLDIEGARSQYQKVISMMDDMENDDINAVSLSYAGLARIADADGDVSEAKKLYRKALKKTSMLSLRKESEDYLSSH